MPTLRHCGTNFLPVIVPDRDLEVKELPQQPLDLFHHFVPYFLVAKWSQLEAKGSNSQLEANHRARGIHKEITIRDHWKTSRLGHQGSDHPILKVMTFDRYTGRSYQTIRVPNKPIPVGFKIWATAQKGLFLRWLWHEPKKRYGPVSLVTRLRSQRRRRLSTRLNPTQSVVIALINKLPKAIYHVFIDNLFSSANLFRSLRQYGHGATGTARRNCGIYAPFAKLKDDDSAGRRLLQFNEVNLIAWKDNALVLLLSTVFKGDELVIRKRKRPNTD
ncbi:uncharacterized protein NECHADRAFT_88962 [Fusarium vanettenii 77-13-4]|uniref:PiggyBac transposable element-derived protein domain-containing protein n=1 Tax=Fusarium vanettenii (strain ATCC MYA-4622 / CBS 123669 / FGSC 9596 / NRRL 45880 / 77-13-4) TaxID=660122 RepID=C7ZJK7_FUSV7|nr:uncharacterized protein NECHADRAFT_88962 [Fusarium vanettenii 77-13-4]EEU35807.1 hypothetical protein NECHADRAFT_88962 [Fusarium vanettenii 77-13-4]